MEILGSLFLVLALLIGVALFIGRPFLQKFMYGSGDAVPADPSDSLDHRLSGLLAERDRILTALQELEFDYTLGKIPAEDYPLQRSELLHKGSAVLRELDGLQPANMDDLSAEDRIEAAVATRRADASQQPAGQRIAVSAGAGATGRSPAAKDGLEDLIASRRRQRQEKTSGFCPRCGRPVLKSDKFCSKCGTTL
jgi:hypothetical protein